MPLRPRLSSLLPPLPPPPLCCPPWGLARLPPSSVLHSISRVSSRATGHDSPGPALARARLSKYELARPNPPAVHGLAGHVLHKRLRLRGFSHPAGVSCELSYGEPLSDSGSDEVRWCLGFSPRELPERGVSDQRLGTLIGAEPAGSRAAYLSYGFYG